jgi:secondary thiamine-phosphate synthase enzyme
MKSLELRSKKRTEWIDITARVQELVRGEGLCQGLCVVYCPHTTAALTINENADPDVVHDVLAWLNRAVPKEQPDFRHGEGNSDAHIKASLVGCSVTLCVTDGKLVMGQWQGIFFCEFDGPRTRTVHVQLMAG